MSDTTVTDTTLTSLPDTDYMLTTLNNPYNPFTQWDEWDAFDKSMGYNTCAYLARVAVTSDELSEVDNDLATAEAMDSIIDLNLTGNYIKVTRKGFTNRAISGK